MSQISKEERRKQILEELKNLQSNLGNASGTSNTNNEKYLKIQALEKELMELEPPPGF